jgi:hypothetical protein
MHSIRRITINVSTYKDKLNTSISWLKLVVLGGLVDIVLATGPNVRGFTPDQGR